MKVKKSDLVRLLTAVQRKAVVAGKLCPQVFSCVLRPQDGKVRTGSLKRTTLMANENALAFPSSTVSILEWEEKSLWRSNAIVLEPSSLGKYITGSDKEIEAYSQALVKVSDLKEALSAGSINGQRLGRVEFRTDEPDEEGVCILEVVVGSELKGKTVTPIGDGERGGIKALTVEGGLENAIEFFDDEDLLILDFFDFTEFGSLQTQESLCIGSASSAARPM
jgi:hypothetical protein